MDHLLRNAQLRNDLEPFFDESITRLNLHDMPTTVENEYLASMLAWERAPVLPIAEWFTPVLQLPMPDTLDDAQLHDLLWATIQKLFDQRIALHYTDHLNDRQLYCLICRDILPSPEKKIDGSQSFLHWTCVDAEDDSEIWYRYYATEEERQLREESGELLPDVEPLPFPRKLPRKPF